MMKCCSWFVLFLLLPLSVWSAEFRAGEEVGVIGANDIDEASGLAASWRNDGILWTHQDMGDGPIIYAITINGEYLGGYRLENVFNRDVEDIAVGPGPEPGVSYIYLGDIGNNNMNQPSRETIEVYRVKEPLPPSGGIIMDLGEVDTITIRIPSGEEYVDCECLMVDPLLGELYVLRKEPNRITTIYATPSNTIFMPGSIFLTLEERGLIDGVAWVTGGDISRNGREILVKRVDRIYYFQRNGDNPVSSSLINLEGFQELPYEKELQGEAITFSIDLAGYYTLSESKGADSVPLLFYPRDAPFSRASNGTESDIYIPVFMNTTNVSTTNVSLPESTTVLPPMDNTTNATNATNATYLPSFSYPNTSNYNATPSPLAYHVTLAPTAAPAEAPVYVSLGVSEPVSRGSDPATNSTLGTSNETLTESNRDNSDKRNTTIIKVAVITIVVVSGLVLVYFKVGSSGLHPR